MIQKEMLNELYITKGLSMNTIANKLGCSANQVVYWMDKHSIKRRTISDAIYLHSNPNGDPFKITKVKSVEEAELFGIGIGLYWGEGNKRNKHSVRLGNTDPGIIKIFMRFLIELCGVDKNKLKFGLQIFSDTNPEVAKNFWVQELTVNHEQFTKVIVTKSRGAGTYLRKSEHGVITVQFHNYKLRDIIVSMCRDSSVGRARLW
jgi:hypothetical protein